MKTALHRSFLSTPKYFETVVNGVNACVDRIKLPVVQQDPDVSIQSVQTKTNIDWLSFCVERISLKAVGPKILKETVTTDKQNKKTTEKKAGPPRKAIGNAFLDKSAGKLREAKEFANSAKMQAEEQSDDEEEEAESQKKKAKTRQSRPDKHVEGLEPSKLGLKRKSGGSQLRSSSKEPSNKVKD